MYHVPHCRLRLIASLLIVLLTVTVSLIGLTNAFEAAAVQPARAAAPLFVRPNGIGNCLSWENACNLAKALSNDLPPGSEIWVAKGVHRPTTNTAERGASFQLKSNVAIYGGFDPDSGADTFAERNWVAYPTILSGDIGDDDQTLDGVVTSTAFIKNSNSYHVVTSNSSVTATTRLDGFIITAGRANNDTVGGGMYNNGGSPVLTHILFSGNFGTYGGGLYNNDNSNPTLIDVTFQANRALEYGGGIFNDTNSNPTLADVHFTDNLADAYGGGIFSQSSSPALSNVTFDSNRAGIHGGGMFNQSSSPQMFNVTFSNNRAENSGGGIYNSTHSNPAMTQTAFNDNWAAIHGGGISSADSSPTLTETIFNNNSAGDCGGGMYSTKKSVERLRLTNVTFISNHAKNGGGMCNSASVSELVNVTFDGNQALTSGGGICNINSSQTLTETAFNANSANNGGGIYNASSSPKLIDATFYSNTANNGGGIFNISSSPQLINATFSANLVNSLGGGMYNEGSNPSLTNAIFYDNKALSGGGVYNTTSSKPTLTNVTLNKNQAVSGGGMSNTGSSNATLFNAIFWDNQANASAQISNTDGGKTVIHYSLIEDGCPAGSDCYDLIQKATDPGFVDAANGNLRLKGTSLVIDAGDNTAPGLLNVNTDRDGKPRFLDEPSIIDGGKVDDTDPDKPIVDLGAYEYNPKLPTNTSLQVTPGTIQVGQLVTFKATVTATSGIPTGSVTFYQGETQLGSKNLSDGTATYTTTTLQVGTYVISADYAGDDHFFPSTSGEAGLVVNPGPAKNYLQFLPLSMKDYIVYFVGEWEKEPNDTYPQANGPLRFAQDYYAYPDNAKDYFSFYLPSPATITVTMSEHTGEGVQILLFDQIPVTNGEVQRDYTAPYHIEHKGKAGWYYIYIYSSGHYNSSSSYTLRVDIAK